MFSLISNYESLDFLLLLYKFEIIKAKLQGKITNFIIYIAKIFFLV